MSGRFRRGGSNYWGFNGRRRYARGRYSGRRVGSSARRARGNMRAANQQNDISNVTINMMKKVKTGVTATFKWDNNQDKIVTTDIGTCALNIFELLRKSDFYQSYSNMYDQFRINRIQVKVTPVTWQTYNQFNIPYQTGNNGSVGRANADPAYPLTDGDEMNESSYQPPSLNNANATNKYIVPQALTIVTAWDRTGLDDTQIGEWTVEGLNENPDTTFKVITIGDAITTYSSAKSTQLVAGANFNCVRYLYPSSQQEKSLYFSTTDLEEQTLAPNTGDKWYYIRTVDNAKYSSSKITNLHADPNCPFKPTFLIGVLKVDDLQPNGDVSDQQPDPTDPDDTLGQIYPVTFNLEFDIGVTFRGLRKTQVV